MGGVIQPIEAFHSHENPINKTFDFSSNFEQIKQASRLVIRLITKLIKPIITYFFSSQFDYQKIFSAFLEIKISSTLKKCLKKV